MLADAGRVNAAGSIDANASGSASVRYRTSRHVPTAYEAQDGVHGRTRHRRSVRVPAAYSQTLAGTLEPTRETRNDSRNDGDARARHVGVGESQPQKIQSSVFP